ncbi:BMC domain-containing protein [Inediibacterium massiliense]|uniref:BMC domain-containing protein n=1 Tax=Inediibacterium massiliense TaxID=1658111 RepID=UPI0006B67B9C|nr:BMC domain-containing protein [Inediibacterium massiliense]
MGQALGFIETYGYIGAIEALDTCLKSAEVEVVDCQLVTGGLVTIIIKGNISAVKAAIDAGAVAADRVGDVVGINVIARAGDGLEKIIYSPQNVEKVKDTKEEENKINLKKENDIKKVHEEAMDIKAKEKSIVYKGKKIEKSNFQILQEMKVVELRRLARQIEGLNIDKKQIKFAKKDELIEVITKYFEEVE